MEYKYPIYKLHKPSKEIIKFTSLQSGVTVDSGDSNHIIGYTSNSFIPHTDSDFVDTDFREPSKFNYYIRKEDV